MFISSMTKADNGSYHARRLLGRDGGGERVWSRGYRAGRGGRDKPAPPAPSPRAAPRNGAHAREVSEREVT